MTYSKEKKQKFQVLSILTVFAITCQSCWADSGSSDSNLFRCPDDLLNLKFSSYKSKDQEIKEILQEKLKKGVKFAEECPAELVKMGMLQSAELLVQKYFLPDGINIDGKFRFVANSLKSKLDALTKTSIAFGEHVQGSPAFKWGQSVDTVKIYLKFAHRIDSPGCLETPKKNILISKKNELSLEATGILAGVPVQWVLHFPLYQPAERESLKYENAGVGAIIITFKKTQPAIWMRLAQTGHKDSKLKSAVWWDIKGEEYEAAMKEMYREMRQNEFEEEGEEVEQEAKLELDPEFF